MSSKNGQIPMSPSMCSAFSFFVPSRQCDTHKKKTYRLSLSFASSCIDQGTDWFPWLLLDERVYLIESICKSSRSSFPLSTGFLFRWLNKIQMIFNEIWWITRNKSDSLIWHQPDPDIDSSLCLFWSSKKNDDWILLCLSGIKICPRNPMKIFNLPTSSSSLS